MMAAWEILNQIANMIAAAGVVSSAAYGAWKKWIKPNDDKSAPDINDDDDSDGDELELAA